MIWLYTIVSIIIVSLISLIGLCLVEFSEQSLEKTLLLLVGFSAGALLGDAFIHIIPEATEGIGMTTKGALVILLGILVFFILEQFIAWHHCHKNTKGKCHPFAYMNLVGDGLHNFIDGAVIAASYMADIKLGVITTIAVLLHEIPQEIGDFGVLVHGGFTKLKALLMNFVSALFSLLGAFLVLIFSSNFGWSINFLLLFTAGGFIYIATADLLPELQKVKRSFINNFLELIFFIFGIAVMLSLLIVE